MAPKHPAQNRGSRGTLSARQWQDLRQAARLSRSEGVRLEWRRDGSITISPLTPGSANAGNRQRQGLERATRDTQPPETQPVDTVDCPRQPSKKQQRDAQRAEDDRALRASPFMARWKLLTQRLVWRANRLLLDSTFTSWRLLRQSARQKIRRAVWREWTRPHIEPPTHIGPPGSRLRAKSQGLLVLGLRSHRDDYILARARALARHCTGGPRTLSGWLRRHAGPADLTMSPGVGTPNLKTRSRMVRGGHGGRDGTPS